MNLICTKQSDNIQCVVYWSFFFIHPNQFPYKTLTMAHQHCITKYTFTAQNRYTFTCVQLHNVYVQLIYSWIFLLNGGGCMGSFCAYVFGWNKLHWPTTFKWIFLFNSVYVSKMKMVFDWITFWYTPTIDVSTKCYTHRFYLTKRSIYCPDRLKLRRMGNFFVKRHS